MARIFSLILLGGLATLGSCTTDNRDNCNVLCTGDLDDCQLSCDADQDCELDCEDEHDFCLGNCDPDQNDGGDAEEDGGNAY